MSRFRMTIALLASIAAGLPQLARTAPPAAENLFSRAVRQYGDQDWAAAATDFERFLTSQPESPRAPEATYWQGECLVQRGSPVEADRVYERLVKKWPEHRLASEAWFRRGEIAFWSGRAEDARQWLERYVDSTANSRQRFYALVYLAEMAVEREDLPDVELLRNRFLEWERDERSSERSNTGKNANGHHPLRPAIDRAWGKSLLQAAQYELAEQVFSDKRLRTPEDAFYHGVALLGLKRFDDAERRTKDVWANELPSELRPRLLILRASALIELSRDDDAVRVLDECLETMPTTRDSLWARQQRLDIPLRQGRIDEAIVQWTVGAGSDLSPNERGRIGLTLAEAAFTQGDQAAATQVYLAIVDDEQLAADHAAAHVSLGWIYWKQNDVQAARRAFAQCVASRPNPARLSEASFGLGQAYERLGDVKSAISAFEQVTVRPSTDVHVAPALLALARLYSSQREHERAESNYRRLNDEFPQIRQRDAALYGWSWTLADLARRDDAVRVWQRLTAEFPASPFAADARLRLAEDAQRRHQPRDAQRWLDELLARPIDPTLAEHAIYLRGRMAADAGEWATLENEMRKLSDGATSPELRRAADYWLAEALYRRDAWPEALDRFTRLDEWAIEQAERVSADQSSGEKPNESRSTANGGVERTTDLSWLAVIPLRRAQLLARQSRWADARRVVESARNRFPNFRFAYEWDFIEGQCLAALHLPDEARQAWERVVRSPSGGRTETAAAAQWQIGQSWQLAGNVAAAEDAFAALERLYPSSPWRVRAMLGRAQCLERQQEWEAAVRAYAGVIQEFPVGSWSEQAEAGLREARRAALQRR